MTKARKPTKEQVKDIADRAEGIKPDEPERLGRPPSYKETFAPQAEKLCQLGATDVEMADFFEVAVSTFYKWKNEYPVFSEALKAGKAAADDRVERSLYHRAIGYTFEAEKIFQYQGEVVRASTREHVPPDTTACIFWLKNRRQQQWRDVHKHEVGEPGAFDRMSEAEIVEAITREVSELGLVRAGRPNKTAH